MDDLSLLRAAEAGDVALCSHILDAAANSSSTASLSATVLQPIIDCVDQNGASALMIACTRDSVELVSLLLQRGANVHLYRHHGQYTALHSSCARGFTEIARLLLNAGANVDSTDAIGATPLSLACANGHLVCATLLVQTGNANVSLADVNGCAPLHHTTDLSVCLMLIQLGGANPMHRDYKGKTAVDAFSKGSRGYGRDGGPATRRLRVDTLTRAFRIEDNWRRRKAFLFTMTALGFTRPKPLPCGDGTTDTTDTTRHSLLPAAAAKERRWLLLLDGVFGQMAFRELVASFL